MWEYTALHVVHFTDRCLRYVAPFAAALLRVFLAFPSPNCICLPSITHISHYASYVPYNHYDAIFVLLYLQTTLKRPV